MERRSVAYTVRSKKVNCHGKGEIDGLGGRTIESASYTMGVVFRRELLC